MYVLNHETGTIEHPAKPGSKVIDEKILEKERKKGYKINRIDRFESRTRHFSESGIIGTKAFVSARYHRFQDYFYSSKEKVPIVRNFKAYQA